MIKKKILLISILLIVCCFSCFAFFTAWAPAFELHMGYYGAFSLSSYLDAGVPVRTQGVGKFYIDVLSFSIGRFQAGGAVSLLYVTPSLAFNQNRLKGFIGIGGRVFISYFVSDIYCLGLGSELNVNYFGTDVKSGSISGIIYNEFLVTQNPYYNFSLVAPLEVAYRKDILGISLSIGLKMRYKGYWIQEGL